MLCRWPTGEEEIWRTLTTAIRFAKSATVLDAKCATILDAKCAAVLDAKCATISHANHVVTLIVKCFAGGQPAKRRTGEHW